MKITLDAAVYGPFILAIFAILWAWLFFIGVIPL